MTRNAIIIAATAAMAAACASGTKSEVTVRALEAECVRAESDAPAGAWICGDELTVECDTNDGAIVDDIYVVETSTAQSCTAADFAVNEPGPFEPGEHVIIVERIGVGPVCTSTLTVADTTLPETNSATVALWPPNHKYHSISADDCAGATDRCDDDVEVDFTYATSDEPVNDNGDGNSEPDIVFGCDTIQVRSERQGGSNGRVYTLGYRAVDDAGNETLGECHVYVTHDQSGRDAIDDGESYRVEPPSACP